MKKILAAALALWMTMGAAALAEGTFHVGVKQDVYGFGYYDEATGEFSGAHAPPTLTAGIFPSRRRAGPTTTAAALTLQAGHHYGEDRLRPRQNRHVRLPRRPLRARARPQRLKRRARAAKPRPRPQGN